MLNYQSGFAKKSTDSAYPSLWRGLKRAWVPQLARTGNTLRDHKDGVAILYNNPKQRIDGLLYSGSAYGITDVKVTDFLSDADNKGLSIVFRESHTSTSAMAILSCVSATTQNGLYVILNQASGFTIPQRIDIRFSGSGTRACIISTLGEKLLSDNVARTHIITIGPNFSANSFEYYINGIRQNISIVRNTYGLLSTHNLLINIARYNINAIYSKYFSGKLGPIYLYNRALNTGEVRVLSQNIMSPFIPKVKMFGPVAPAPPRPTTLPYYDTNIVNISRSRIHILSPRTRSVVLPRRF